MRLAVAHLAIAVGLVAWSATPAHAQIDSREGIALQNQIYQLRQALKAVEDQTARGPAANNRYQSYAPPPQYGGNDLVAQLLTRVDALEDQLRQLRGRIDETQNQLDRQNQDFGKRIDDLAFQTNTRPASPAPAQPLSPGPEPGLIAPNPPPPRTSVPSGPRVPEAAMREGNAALARRDYAAAEAAAREVLANRTSSRAYDAQFLLAQALAGERQFPQAAVAYDDVYNRSRTGSHAQDARLGLASSLTSINEKKAACDVLARMQTEFSQLRPDVSAGIAATSQRAGCH